MTKQKTELFLMLLHHIKVWNATFRIPSDPRFRICYRVISKIHLVFFIFYFSMWYTPSLLDLSIKVTALVVVLHRDCRTCRRLCDAQLSSNSHLARIYADRRAYGRCSNILRLSRRVWWLRLWLLRE